MLWYHILNHYIPSGCSGRTHKGPRLNLIRNDGILGPVEPVHPSDADGVCSGPLYVGAHTVKEVGNVNNMRLLGRVLQYGLPLCKGCRHHDIDGCTNRNHIQINVACHQINGMGNHSAPLNDDLGAQSPEPFDMLVNGPAADIASPRKGHLGALILT